MGAGWNALPKSIAEEVEVLRGQRQLFVLGVLTALLHLWFNSIGNLAVQDQNILHFAFFVLLCGLAKPIGQGGVIWADRGFTVLLTLAALYLLWGQDAIHERGLRLNAMDWLAGSLVIFGAVEMSRRAAGLIIPLLIILALSYIAWWGQFVPGVFRFAGLSLETLMFRSLFGDDALFGNITGISASFVFLFIIFGAFLLRSGAGDFVIHLSRALAGRVVGGPGIVAVLASGLTGTISGSAIANTASTGVVTIPLMKQAGFPARFAAAIEASASTGGQLMPPIMGAGAFVMANYTGIPYATIVAVAFLPALLYFLSLVFYVRVESFKRGLRKPMEKSPPLMPLMFGEGLSFILPVGLLIGLLIAGFTPTYAAVFAIVAVIVSSWFTPVKMGPAAILDALALGARNMVVTAVLLCAVGLIVNVIATAGIGNTFSLMMIEWADGNLLVALLLVALASLVLGMGMPVTASYIVLATLSAPALFNMLAEVEMLRVLMSQGLPDQAAPLVMLSAPDLAQHAGALSQLQAETLLRTLPGEIVSLLQPMLLDEARLGLLLLSAHMIIFWLSQDSNVTPPVCLCTFTAAAIAGTPPMATGFSSWKLAKALYLVPLLIAYTPLISANLLQALEVAVFAAFGLYAFIAAVQGWMRQRLGSAARLLAAVCAFGLMWPAQWWLHLAFLGVFFGLVWWDKRNVAPGEV